MSSFKEFNEVEHLADRAVDYLHASIGNTVASLANARRCLRKAEALDPNDPVLDELADDINEEDVFSAEKDASFI